jgi:hypothetical protein
VLHETLVNICISSTIDVTGGSTQTCLSDELLFDTNFKFKVKNLISRIKNKKPAARHGYVLIEVYLLVPLSGRSNLAGRSQFYYQHTEHA